MEKQNQLALVPWKSKISFLSTMEKQKKSASLSTMEKHIQLALVP